MATFRPSINEKDKIVYDPTMNSVSTKPKEIYDPTAKPEDQFRDKIVSPAPTGNTSSPKKSGGSGGGSSSKSTFTPVTVTPVDDSIYAYDPSTNQAYQNAMAALEKAKGELPQYAGTYDGQLDALYQQIVGRDKFSYDLNEDMFYQQAADRAMQMGNMAMMDTMGQAASLTGGYGNTYAQNVGQQAYQGYLQQLNDNIPQYYQMALDAYNAEGDQMMQQYGMLGDLANREYSMYQDDLANYWQNVGYLQDVADTEYGRGYDNWYNAEQMKTSQQGKNYERLVTMMSAMGYKPTAEEFAAAGLNTEQANALLKYYSKKKASGGGGSGSKFNYNSFMSDALAELSKDPGSYSDVYKTITTAADKGLITAEQRTEALYEIYKQAR